MSEPLSPVIWITDPHFNHCSDEHVDRFLNQVLERSPSSVLISGDFSEAPQLEGYIRQLAERLPCLIYFVLGNHDFYFGSIDAIRRRVRELAQQFDNLVYLTGSVPHELMNGVALIGDDGWADGRHGDYTRSLVMMYDYKLIEELAGMDRLERWALLKELGDQAGRRVRRQLESALTQHRRILLLTHIPPFLEACWHEGRISNEEWSPHFTCKAVGDVLIDVMNDHPDQELVVLCGHTHSSGFCQPLANITVYTGSADYGSPCVNGHLDAAGNLVLEPN